MDNNKSQYFYYGGIFSASVFTVLLLSLYLMIRFEISTPVYTQTDNVLISVNLDAITLDNAKSIDTNKMALPSDELEEPSENIDDLFDSIDSEKIVYSKDSVVKDTSDVVDQDFLKKIQTRKDIKHEKDTTIQKQSVEELNLEYGKFKSDNKSLKASGGEKDIYKAKVYALLHRGWQHTSQKFRLVKVDIRISTAGKMRYKIRQVSGDSLFDSSLQAHLEYLLDTIFPIPPDGESFHFEVKFSTKGK